MVGPYRLLRLLGEGGMGMVYLAEHVQFVRRRVALKVIKPGMDTRAIVARFEAEREAIALMDHPSIARIFDAGVTRDRRPYFVMEYVAGVPITEYCDHERLSIAARLALFAEVCAAVHHAHEKLIIHRDLKPSNVLVTIVDGRPLPKVIDFGVAKALSRRLTHQTTFTEFGALVGTPEYMSPEQLDLVAPDVDSRSDIYALGILLYELLTGTLPFDRARLRAASYEIRRIVREEEPVRPSMRAGMEGTRAAEIAELRSTTMTTLLRSLGGDLDWICLKALEKDRQRRYASAAELNADIRRFLGHEPVTARPPTAAYRLRKYLRRHRARVTASAVIGAALVLGFGTNVFLTSRYAAEPPGTTIPRAATVEVVTRTGFAGGPALSPDGRRVAFGENRYFDANNLWLADIETGTTERLPIPSAPNYQYLQWPRSGNNLYFGTLLDSKALRLLRYSVATQTLEPLSTLNMAWLAVSPDERRLAGVREDRDRGSSVLVVANLDGSEEREVASRPIEEPYFLLSWSPDGRTIASIGNLGIIGKPMYVAAIDVTNGRERLLSNERWTRALAKAWLPDSRGILMLGQKWGERQRSDSWLWHVDAHSGAVRQIPIGPDELAGWSLSLGRPLPLEIHHEFLVVRPAERRTFLGKDEPVFDYATLRTG